MRHFHPVPSQWRLFRKGQAQVSWEARWIHAQGGGGWERPGSPSHQGAEESQRFDRKSLTNTRHHLVLSLLNQQLEGLNQRQDPNSLPNYLDLI